MFSLWVDADSCPVEIRKLLIRFSNRLEIPLYYVANRMIPHEGAKYFKMIITSTDEGSADDYIVENASPEDLVITRDIPLAARLISKGLTSLNDRGDIFTEENIGEKLALRNLNLDLFMQGLKAESHTQLGKKEMNRFANALDRLIQKKLKEIKTDF
jgi:uncharacterized protein YaiI (UPF0178 family)